MELPHTTDKQLDTLLYIYKFRFLHTNQFQKLFHHKEPQTAQEWLKDLREKGYVVYRDFNRKEFEKNTKPAIYSLTKLARRLLKTHPKCDLAELNRVYQEDGLSEPFVNRYVFIADIFLNLSSQMNGQEILHFSTQANLRGFDYFPSPMPDAFIAIKTPKKKRRYFLYLLDKKTPWFVLDRRMERFTDYSDDNDWANYSKDPLPSFLMICPTERTKKHLYKIISDRIPDGKFFLTTKEKILNSGFKGDVWEKVE